MPIRIDKQPIQFPKCRINAKIAINFSLLLPDRFHPITDTTPTQ